MKKRLLMMWLAAVLAFTGCANNGNHTEDNKNTQAGPCENHADADANGSCDICKLSVIEYVDLYSINDLHGKVADGSSHPGVDELTTYLKNAKSRDEHMIVISAGDMWQGSSESNMTKGHLMTDWMNYMGFAAMTLGNHEYDWGEEFIKSNAEIANFPFLAINIYDRETNQQVEYCQSSVVVEAGDVQVGIIGAMGDCYTSIAAERVKDVYFKVGEELTALVKAESEKLRQQGVDCIVYVIHDGLGESKSDSVTDIGAAKIKSYYDVALSDGYVDLVFEAHTHQKYILKDEHGVYHLQHRGDNSGGISHVELGINTVTGDVKVNMARLVSTDVYKDLPDDAIVEQLLEKYKDDLAYAYEVLGTNDYERKSNYIGNLVMNLYLEVALEKWGAEYDIVLAGGSVSTRKPYDLKAGNVTYADLQSILPFDNELTLCTISGSDLMRRFMNNSEYRISYSEYGKSIMNNIDPNGTYYIVADTWSSDYAPNKTTIVARYGTDKYARDFLAEYIKEGGLTSSK